MKIELVSYVIKDHVRYEPLDEERLNKVINLINSSEADLIVFAGWTLDLLDDLPILLNHITNKKTAICLEIFDESQETVNANKGFVIVDGEVVNVEMSQQFSTSGEVNKNDVLIKELLDKLETDRKFDVKGKSCLWLSCGELNILKNLQGKGNKVVFRSVDKQLDARFNTLLDQSDLIINPIHSPMGNQGKMSKRREFLSAKGKVYLSTSNVYAKKGKSNDQLLSYKLQYVLKDGEQLEPVESLVEGECLIQLFEI